MNDGKARTLKESLYVYLNERPEILCIFLFMRCIYSFPSSTVCLKLLSLVHVIQR